MTDPVRYQEFTLQLVMAGDVTPEQIEADVEEAFFPSGHYVLNRVTAQRDVSREECFARLADTREG